MQIIEKFNEKELLKNVVQVKQVESDPTIPKRKTAPKENGIKRGNSGQATLVPKRPRLEKKTEDDTKVPIYIEMFLFEWLFFNYSSNNKHAIYRGQL